MPVTLNVLDAGPHHDGQEVLAVLDDGFPRGSSPRFELKVRCEGAGRGYWIWVLMLREANGLCITRLSLSGGMTPANARAIARWCWRLVTDEMEGRSSYWERSREADNSIEAGSSLQ